MQAGFLFSPKLSIGKEIEGDIICLLDKIGAEIVQYTYDAWGNYAVSGNVELGELNPFRYRGYYYDTETDLYYLQTRYYDPEIGRFISQDDVSYLDPEHINGLNLYAYCGNNPVMNVDPTGEVFLSILLVALVGAVAAGVSSIVTQLSTTGKVNWAQVGISALFGAVGGVLSFTGVGGIVGQFIIQGALAVGELYSIAALEGNISSIGFEQVAATFLFAGALGAIGSKNAAKEFKRVLQIEESFIKYTVRDITRYETPIISTVLKRGAKYFSNFLKPWIQQTAITSGVTVISNFGDYWIQKLYNYFN